WRQVAAEQIDRIRKADLTVIVTDSSGEPVARAKVRAAMQRHAFGFGTAVAADRMPGGRRENEEYARHVKELFNRATIENALKWPQWQRAGGPDSQAMRTLRWLGEQDMLRHGHVMVWPSWSKTPDELEDLADEPEKLAAAVREHIIDIASATRGLTEEWDVINEPFANHDLMDVLGRDAMADWFRTAREHAPGTVLMINDYGILNTGGRLNTDHQNHYHETVAFLLEQDAPLDAIGLQGHFGWRLTPPRRLWDILDRFAEFDLPLHVTEFDVNISDEPLQARYTRDFLTAVFAHEAVESFTMWGFWEGRHWRPDAAIMREDFSMKPNGEAYRELVFEKWWTDENVATDTDGRAVIRGFKGDYELTVESDGRAVRRKVSLGDDGASVKVRLE
ncbi:MAG: endo-1,4-beta-xylanase, partial [Planctomycetota bacterium]